MRRQVGKIFAGRVVGERRTRFTLQKKRCVKLKLSTLLVEKIGEMPYFAALKIPSENIYVKNIISSEFGK